SFELKENLIVLECSINGTNQTFILDSSSPKVILNSKYLKNLYENHFELEQNSVATSPSPMDTLTIQTLTFGGIEIKNSLAVTMDLSHIEEALKTEIHGMIGYEILKDYNIFIDYKGLKIGFWSDDEMKAYIDQHTHHSCHFE